MPLTMKRRQALLGATIAATLLSAVGAGLLPRLGHASPAAVHPVASATEAPTGGVPSSSDPQPTELASAAASTDSTPTSAAQASSVAPPADSPSTAAPSIDAGSPATHAASGASGLAPGERVNPTSAEVQAAIAALHQRIPLFAPSDQQLRAFADAVCASFDQGQTQAQVQSTVQDAVSRIQGASLSAADAAFAVRTVVELRCPGYV